LGPLVILWFVAACGTERLQAPRIENGPLFDLGDPVDCSTQIIPDPECPPPETYAPMVVYYDSIPADSTVQQFSVEVPSDSVSYYLNSPPTEIAVCPRTASISGTYQLHPPVTSNSYQFNASGLLTMDLIQSAPLLFSSQAIYNFPRGYQAGGYWSGYNITRSQYAEIFVAKVRSTCELVQMPNGQVFVGGRLIQYYGVLVREAQQEPAGGGGGGGGGPDDNCSYEFITIEINYGDGTGWHELWSGWAWVCS
jgi:hypothetical protein